LVAVGVRRGHGEDGVGTETSHLVFRL
jgi:hypothetical protein